MADYNYESARAQIVIAQNAMANLAASLAARQEASVRVADQLIVFTPAQQNQFEIACREARLALRDAISNENLILSWDPGSP